MKMLQIAMAEVEKASSHQGYKYHIQDILVSLMLGLMCGLKTIEEIHHWCTVPHNEAFLFKEFSIKKTPCKSHFESFHLTIDEILLLCKKYS